MKEKDRVSSPNGNRLKELIAKDKMVIGSLHEVHRSCSGRTSLALADKIYRGKSYDV